MPAGYTDKFPNISKDPATKAQYKKERRRKEVMAQQYHPAKLLPGMHEGIEGSTINPVDRGELKGIDPKSLVQQPVYRPTSKPIDLKSAIKPLEEEGDDKVVPIKSRTEKMFSVLMGRDPTPDERKKLRMSVLDFIRKYPSTPRETEKPVKKTPPKSTGKVLQFKSKIIPFEPWGKSPPPKKGK